MFGRRVRGGRAIKTEKFQMIKPNQLAQSRGKCSVELRITIESDGFCFAMRTHKQTQGENKCSHTFLPAAQTVD